MYYLYTGGIATRAPSTVRQTY
jgi:hypothetical protein